MRMRARDDDRRVSLSTSAHLYSYRTQPEVPHEISVAGSSQRGDV